MFSRFRAIRDTKLKPNREEQSRNLATREVDRFLDGGRTRRLKKNRSSSINRETNDDPVRLRATVNIFERLDRETVGRSRKGKILIVHVALNSSGEVVYRVARESLVYGSVYARNERLQAERKRDAHRHTERRAYDA